MILVTVFLAGCQPTPETDIVVQKDLEQMIDMAQATVSPEIEKQSLVTRYAIKEHIDNEMTEADGKLVIHIDADVRVPDTDIVSIVRVKPGKFSQETVTSLFTLLCGDTPMYQTRDVYTKAEIDAAIVRCRELQSENPGTGRDYEAEIARYVDQYESAPEVIEEIPSDGTLEENAIYADSETQEGFLGNNTMLEARSVSSDMFWEKGKLFYVWNYSDQTEPVEVVINDPYEGTDREITMDPSYSAYMTYVDYDRDFEWSYEGMRYVGADDAVPEEAQPYLSTTPMGAKEIAERFFTEAQIPFCVQDILLIGSDTPENIGEVKYAYRLECVRQVSRVNSAVAQGSGSGGDGDATMPYWPYEHMMMYVDNDGIYQLDWTAPYEIADTVVENANLLPFSDIENTFFEMMKVTCEPEAHNELVNSITINVNRVELQLYRISEQNHNESGLLVPVWCFYGSKTVDEQVQNEGMMHDWESGTPLCFLIVNAVDGTIINSDEGY
jgi:hypothetical protein